jgi:3-dehydroquinate synthetase
MVDSSIGGKTGADLPQGKNLIGSFYPPRNVIIDPLVLKTLPRVELENGMAEVIKHGVIGDPLLFSSCRKEKVTGNSSSLSELVKRALAVKVKIIESDPYEKGFRESLNFGHTIGHGIELVSNFKVRHGEAVAIGMVAESKLGEMQGIVDEGLSDVISKTLISQNLPVSIPSGLDKDEIINVIRRDKKVSNGKVNFAIPASVGDMKTGIVINGWERILDK